MQLLVLHVHSQQIRSQCQHFLTFLTALLNLSQKLHTLYLFFCSFSLSRRSAILPQIHLQGVPLQRVYHGEKRHQPLQGRVPGTPGAQPQRQEGGPADRALPGA